MTEPKRERGPLRRALHAFQERIASVEPPPHAFPLSSAAADLIMAAVSDGIVLLDAEGAILDVNPALLRMSGFARHELVGAAPPYPFWPRTEAATLDAIVRRALAGQGDDVELSYQRRDGEVLPVLQRSFRLAAGSGEPACLLVARDLTSQHRARAALSENQRVFFETERLASTGSWEWNLETGDLRWSPEMYRLHGMTPPDGTVTLETALAAVHTDDVARVSAATQRVLEAGEEIDLEYRLQLPDGTERQVRRAGRVVRDRDGGARRVVGYLRDVTARREHETTLRRSSRLVRSFEEQISVVGRDYRYRFANPAYTAVHGVPTEQIVGSPVSALLGETAFATIVKPRLDEAFAGREVAYEAWFDYRRAGKRYTAVRYLPLSGADGEVDEIVVVTRDLTEGRRNADAAVAHEERYQALFAGAPDGIVVCAEDGRIVDANPAACLELGYERDELLAMRVGDLVEKDDGPAFARDLAAARDGDAVIEERWLQRASGPPMLAVITATAPGDAPMFVMMRNVTERRRSEAELRRSRGQLRRLAARWQAIREEERRVIAREIHDVLGQQLTGLRMDVSWVASRMITTSPELQERCREMDALIAQSIESVRDLSARLRPPALDFLGLGAAIESEAAAFGRRTSIDCVCSVPPQEPKVDDETAIAVFRILQESLTNVARHAQAKRVGVVLETDHEHVRLSVRDDGVGLGAEGVQIDGSLGLLGMRERALACRGEFEIRNGAGGGTLVTVSVPLRGAG